MYSVSNDYLTALKKQTHKNDLRGYVQNVAFSADDITELRLTNRCSNDGEVTIGSVYTAELKIVFVKNLGISWANSKGWKITFEEGLLLENNNYEYVTGGEYYIEEVNETKSGIEVVCYDAMLKFDKKFGDVVTRARTLPAILTDVCEEVGVELANDDFSDFPNYNTSFTLSTDNDISTYRDIVSWICQTMDCFSTINRDGELELRRYQAVESYIDEIDADAISEDYAFNLYSTSYSGLSAVDTQRQQTKYFNVEPDNALTYNLGTNPFMQNLNENRFRNVCLSILNDMQAVQYSPFKMLLLPTLVYDLGDIIKFNDSSYGCIMLFDYSYNSSIQIEGLGSDPALSTAESKTDKNLEGILKKTESNKEYIYSFRNETEITLTNEWQTIFSERFGANDNTHAIFQAELLCDDPSGSVTEVRYLLDGNIVSYYPIETWIAGKHILSLYYLLDVQSDTFYNFVMQMKSDSAVTIDAFDGRGSIRGQGLASTEAWDGYINIEENYSLLDDTNNDTLISFTETSSTTLVDYVPSAISESYGLLDDINNDTLFDYESVIGFDGIPLSMLTWDEAAQMTWEYVESAYVWGFNDNN